MHLNCYAAISTIVYICLGPSHHFGKYRTSDGFSSEIKPSSIRLYSIHASVNLHHHRCRRVLIRERVSQTSNNGRLETVPSVPKSQLHSPSAPEVQINTYSCFIGNHPDFRDANPLYLPSIRNEQGDSPRRPRRETFNPVSSHPFPVQLIQLPALSNLYLLSALHNVGVFP